MKVLLNKEAADKVQRIFCPDMFLFFFFLFLIFAIYPVKHAQAAVLKLYYHDTTYSYTGTQAKVTVDGISVYVGDCPGILVDDTVLLSAEDIFQDQLEAEYSYDSESGEIKLSAFGNEIVLYIDSTIAYVNGNKETLSTAPLYVEYVKTGEEKVLVPARSVSEALGYGYIWNASKKRAEFAIPFNLYYNGKWTVYDGVQGKVKADGEDINLGKMPAITINDCVMVPSKKVFSSPELNTKYTYNEAAGTVTIKGNGVTLVFTAGSADVLVNDKSVEAPEPMLLITNGYNDIVYVMIPLKFAAEQLHYGYAWNASTKTAEIYTSQDAMLNENGYYFITEGTETAQRHADTLLKLGDTSVIQTGATGAELSGVFYNENNEFGERYIISGNVPLGNIASSFDQVSKIFTITIENTLSAENSYSFGKTIIESAVTSYDTITGKTMIAFQTTVDRPDYKLSLSEDQCNLYIDFYDNCLKEMSAQKNGEQDILIFTGALGLINTYVTQEGILTFTFPHTRKGFDTNTLSLSSDTAFLGDIVFEESEEHTLVVTVNYKGKFYIQSSDNRIQVMFYSSEGSSGEYDAFDIYIPLPDSVSFSAITDSDPYADKKFKLTLPGNYIDYYENNTVITNNDVVTKVSIAENSSGTKTVLTIKTSKIQGYQYYDADGYIGIKLGSLRKMYKNIVLLDAGHGGKDSGATKGKYQEKDFNLTILYEKAKEYFNHSDIVKAFWTRADDTFIDLYERPKMTKKAKADLFISLHMNSASSSSAKGLEVYYSKINQSESLSGLTSKKMAEIFQESLIDKIGCFDRGYKSAEYVVVKYNTVPAILIELGFITNSTDLSRLKNGNQQQKAAKAIYDTVVDIFEEYPTGR